MGFEKFPEEALTRIMPDPSPGSPGPWNAGLQREEIPVSSRFFPISGVRMESVASVQRHVQFNPPDDRLKLMPIGTPISRVAIWIAALAIPAGIPIPLGGLPINFLINLGSNSASSRVCAPTLMMQANKGDYSGLLCQVSGLLCNQIEVWARIDPNAVPAGVKVGAYIKLHMHMDRLGGTPVGTTVSVLNGPDTL